MKAFVYHRYGTSDDVLRLEDVDVPAVGDDQVLVRVLAASVNPFDWHSLTGKPYIVRLSAGLGRPKETRVGVDMAGRVEAVGRDVTLWRPGDEVFGMRTGAFGEYVVCGQERLARKPSSVTFEQAAAVPLAGLTALQALRDKAGIHAGQRVLVNGASGGVGTLGVQIAKAYRTHVTAVCSTRNVDTVRSLGADRVIDYTKDDFVHSGQKYDLILHVNGMRSAADFRRALTPTGRVVMVSGPKKNAWVGPLWATARVTLASAFSTQKMLGMLTSNSKADLDLLAQFMAEGKLAAFIERTHPLHELPRAMAYVGAGHARGKIVVTIG